MPAIEPPGGLAMSIAPLWTRLSLLTLILSLGPILALAAVAAADIPFTKHVVATGFDGVNCVHGVDVDDDGDVDVLGTAFFGDELALWRNDGGTPPFVWSKQVIDGSVDGAHYVRTADLDEDEDFDLLVAVQVGGEIAWYRNDGGSPLVWTKHVVDASYAGAQQVHATDVDGDDDLDLVCCAYLADDVSWYRNDGGTPIAWAKQTIARPIGQPVSAFVADMDGDSDPDVLAAGYAGHRVSWWRNDGGSPVAWVWQTIESNFTGAHEVWAGKLDNDADTDVLACAYALDDVAWWRNDGGSPIAWTKQTIAGNFNGVASCSGADLDDDGDIDVLATAQDAGQLMMRRNDGGDPITWVRQLVDDNLPGAWAHEACDLDKDGDLDVLAGGNSADVVVWYENMLAVDAPVPGSARWGRGVLRVSPNPFGQETAVRFNLARERHARLEVVDVTGRRVALLADRVLAAGPHTFPWDGRNAGGAPVAAGMYFVRLVADGESSARPLIRVR
jgi:hypothetical protein